MFLVYVLINRMTSFLKLLFVYFVLIFALAGSVFAQTPISTITTSPTPVVISDYAKDVKDGEKETANDVEAQNNQKDVEDNEDIEAQEETEPTEPVEAIELKEAVEPQEAVENESEEGKSGGEGSSEGSGQKSDEQQSTTNEK
ncbi:MAG: hypothetical protein Q8L37_07520 [Candidatus Gottesmanbacteria bacterium]|nr:hypothetical protein [Candidatus Gottesmanbacteria bacterium]